MKTKNYIVTVCENWENHTVVPKGYLQWHAWAEEKSKTHMQIKCEGCDRYEIWVKTSLPKSRKATPKT